MKNKQKSITDKLEIIVASGYVLIFLLSIYIVFFSEISNYDKSDIVESMLIGITILFAANFLIKIKREGE
ncbi:MAG: hypothetical protein KAQ94_02720 [Arcobacteraceae bacterium]|nr:hypothetical protein [Arcobacteraceae bacterium]